MPFNESGRLSLKGMIFNSALNTAGMIVEEGSGMLSHNAVVVVNNSLVVSINLGITMSGADNVQAYLNKPS